MKDIAIVGAGPAGCRLAALLAEDYDVVIIEEHEKIGEPVQCAGLVSPRTIDEFTKDSALMKINDFILHSPSEKTLELHSKKARGIVINRAAFDSSIAKVAKKRGAEIITSTKVERIDATGEPVKLTCRSGSIRSEILSKIVIGADGPKSIVRKSFTNQEFDILYRGAQQSGQLKDDKNAKAVEMWVGNKIAPGFFAWKIPTGSGIRIGLSCLPDHSPMHLLTDFIKTEFPQFEAEESQSGLIPIGQLGLLSNEKKILIGDAAGQTKPMTGGGIYLGKCAAEILANAIKIEGPCPAAGESYEKEFKTQFGRELTRAWRLRRIMNELSDSKIEKAINLLSDRSIVQILESTGDIDYPANLSALIIRKAPQLLQFLPELVKSGF